MSHTLRQTSLGECWVVQSIEAVDKIPDILASRLPVFLDVEFEDLARCSAPSERRRVWERRVKAVAAELAFRASQPGWTVYGPKGADDPQPPPEPAPAADTGGW